MFGLPWPRLARGPAALLLPPAGRARGLGENREPAQSSSCPGFQTRKPTSTGPLLSIVLVAQRLFNPAVGHRLGIQLQQWPERFSREISSGRPPFARPHPLFWLQAWPAQHLQCQCMQCTQWPGPAPGRAGQAGQAGQGRQGRQGRAGQAGPGRGGGGQLAKRRFPSSRPCMVDLFSNGCSPKNG